MEEDLAVEGRNGHVYGIERTSSGHTTRKSRGDKKVGECLIQSVILSTPKGTYITDFSGSEDLTEKGFCGLGGTSRGLDEDLPSPMA